METMETIVERATFLPNPEIVRENCVKECMGCDKMYTDIHNPVLEDHVCIAYANPVVLHRRGCVLQSNKVEIEKKKVKKINPIKASKRGMR